MNTRVKTIDLFFTQLQILTFDRAAKPTRVSVSPRPLLFTPVLTDMAMMLGIKVKVR